jgi:Na+-transporting NADH:ubiquinone oxidoreductase subunit NqrD
VVAGENVINRGVWGNLLVVLKRECSPSMIDCGVLRSLIDGVGRGLGGWMLVVEGLLRGNCMLIENLTGGEWRR